MNHLDFHAMQGELLGQALQAQSDYLRLALANSSHAKVSEEFIEPINTVKNKAPELFTAELVKRRRGRLSKRLLEDEFLSILPVKTAGLPKPSGASNAHGIRHQLLQQSSVDINSYPKPHPGKFNNNDLSIRKRVFSKRFS